MGLKGKLEVEVDIKASADVFHEIFSYKPHHVSNMSPTNIHACVVHEGDFGKPGSVIVWDYTIDGKKCVAKEVVEAIDEEKKFVRFKIIEGDILNDYSSFTLTVQVIPLGDLDGIKWIAEFEKKEDSGPYPTRLIDFCIAVTRDIEAHHLELETGVEAK